MITTERFFGGHLGVLVFAADDFSVHAGGGAKNCLRAHGSGDSHDVLLVREMRSSLTQNNCQAEPDITSLGQGE